MTRLAIAVCCYAAVFAVSLLAALLLRFDFQLTPYARTVFVESALIVVLLKVVIVLFFRDWQRQLRYSTAHDLLWSSAICLAGGILVAALQTAHEAVPRIPRGVIAIDMVVSAAILSMVRVSANLLRTWQAGRAGSDRQRSLIYGRHEDAISLLTAIQSGCSRLMVAGIVTPEKVPGVGLVSGVPTFDVSLGLGEIIRRTRAQQLLLPSNLPGRTVREVSETCRQHGIEAHLVPAVDEISSRRFSLRMRDITIDDLLRREPTQLDQHGIRGIIEHRVVMVTGAAGSIGSEVCRQLMDFAPRKVVLLDQSEFGIFQMEQEFLAEARRRVRPLPPLEFVVEDIRDEASLARVFMLHRPAVIFHAAAYKHVPLMESNPQAAIGNNVFGTRTLVDLADRFGVERFVLISTDKAVRPTNVMGATKLIAEQYLHSVAGSSSTRFVTVRFGNVLNSAGSVVPTFRKQIEDGGPVTVTDPDMQRYFMTIPEAVQLVLQSAAVGEGGDVMILDMGEPVRIVDLARDMIRLSGQRFPEDIDIVFTGLRPGEKLYEELFYESEQSACRVHEKIFRATRANSADAAAIREDIARLAAHINSSREELTSVLWQITSRLAGHSSAAAPEAATVRRAA